MHHNIRVMMMSLCAAAISACSTVDYVKRGDVAPDMYAKAGYVNGEKARYGAIELKTDEESRLFMLRKEKRTYMAETLLSDNSRYADRMFNQAFMAVGHDRNAKALGVRFRLTFD